MKNGWKTICGKRNCYAKTPTLSKRQRQGNFFSALSDSSFFLFPRESFRLFLPNSDARKIVKGIKVQQHCWHTARDLHSAEFSLLVNQRRFSQFPRRTARRGYILQSMLNLHIETGVE